MAKNYVTNFRGESYFTPNDKLHVKEEPVTPIEEDFGDHNRLDYSFEKNCWKLRKSLSMNDIAVLKKEINIDPNDDSPDLFHRYRKTNSSHTELSKTKFVSMAEAIYHYQRDTPCRFHSSKPKLFRPQASTERMELTIPQSPMLRSKARSRAVHVISQKEKEEMELEEIRKFKIKAQPVPKYVIEGSRNIPDVPKKPATKPEPFKLTEIQKKSMQSPNHIQVFKARPAPKHILEKPQIPAKSQVQVTRPVNPKFHYKRSISADNLKTDNRMQAAIKELQKPREKHSEKSVQRHGPVKPEPFSFDKRDEEMKRLKEQKINRQIEEERRQASQFKAQPLPVAVKKQMHIVASKSSSSTTSSENKENYIKFVAQPPVVLFKEPFKPVLQPSQIMIPVPFELTTEKRAVERERFERHIKEREKEQERLKQQEDKERQEAEERAKAELRAKLVHHAKPVPVTRPFIPEKSAMPLTEPQTPKFVRRLKQN